MKNILAGILLCCLTTTGALAQAQAAYSMELFRVAWGILAERKGWVDGYVFTDQRAQEFVREWNSDPGFREAAGKALLDQQRQSAGKPADKTDPPRTDRTR